MTRLRSLRAALSAFFDRHPVLFVFGYMTTAAIVITIWLGVLDQVLPRGAR